MEEHADVYKRYEAEAPNTFLFFQTTGLDGAKVGVLDDNGADLAKQNQSDPNIAKLSAWWAAAKTTAAQDKPIVTAAELHGSKMALRITAVIPCVQAVLLLGHSYLLQIAWRLQTGPHRRYRDGGEGSGVS
jgi:hypothetical protein